MDTFIDIVDLYNIFYKNLILTRDSVCSVAGLASNSVKICWT